MSKSYRVLALIPAGFAGRGIPHKNIEDLNGKPLIAYTIEAALGCSFIDRVIVSTDNLKMREIALNHGADVPFLLPESLLGDRARPIDVLLHGVEYCKNTDDPYDIVVLLKPTYPLRTAEDISAALTMFARTGCDSLCSVNEHREHPVLTRTRNPETGHLLPFLKNQSTVKRQDMPPYFYVNGAIYINYCNDLTENTSLDDNECGFLMERSHSVGVESMEDLLYCEFLLQRSPESLTREPQGPDGR